MSGEIAVVAIVEAKAGRENELAAAIQACVAATRKEQGCLSYVAHSEIDAPRRLVFIERWRDRAALAAHEKQPHFLALVKAFDSLLAAPLQVHLLREMVG